MRSISPVSRYLVVAALLPLVSGCELLAPIMPLPGVDAGRDGGTIDSGRVRDGAADRPVDGPADRNAQDATTDRSDATKVGTKQDAGGEDARRDAAQDRHGAADEGADRARGSDASRDAAVDAAGERRDAAGADIGSSDGGSDAAPPVSCDPSMPFGNATPVYGLNRNPGTEWTLNVSPDELTAYVAVGSAWDLTHPQMAIRASKADPFGPLVPIMALIGPTFEQSISVTGDGLTLFMESNRTGTTRVYISTRQDVNDLFGSPSEIQLEEGTPDEFDPYVLPGGSALYFTSNVVGQGFFWRATLDGTKAALPTVVLEDNTRYPIVSADELTMYFAWVDPATGVWGDIWIATRPSPDVPFGPPTNVSDVNTPDIEYPQWISPDGCRLYFMREPATGGAFSFVAERVRPVPPTVSP